LLWEKGQPLPIFSMKLRGVNPSRTGIRMIAGRRLNQFDLRGNQHPSLGYDLQSLYQKLPVAGVVNGLVPAMQILPAFYAYQK